MNSARARLRRATNCPFSGGIEREICGQCDQGNIALESIQFIAILKLQFETVLKRSL
jgi:hypothetical protein